MGNWKKVLAKSFLWCYPQPQRGCNMMFIIFSRLLLALNGIAFNLIQIRFRFECWHDSWLFHFSSWHGFWMFRIILNYQQSSPASNGREFAKSDFSFGLSKCFFQLFFEIETPAEPHGMRFRGLVNKINACERKYFLRFFLVIREDWESLFFVISDNRWDQKTQTKNQSNVHQVRSN